MAATKARKKTAARAATGRDLIKEMTRTGQAALREARKRVPADWQKRIDRSIRDGQRTIDRVRKDLEAQARKAAKQTDLNELRRVRGVHAIGFRDSLHPRREVVDHARLDGPQLLVLHRVERAVDVRQHGAAAAFDAARVTPAADRQ